MRDETTLSRRGEIANVSLKFARRMTTSRRDCHVVDDGPLAGVGDSVGMEFHISSFLNRRRRLLARQRANYFLDGRVKGDLTVV
jgi:hypothetical protein